MRTRLRRLALSAALAIAAAAISACGDASATAPRVAGDAAARQGSTLWGAQPRPELQLPGGRYELASVNGVAVPLAVATTSLYSGAIWRDVGSAIGRTETTVTGRSSASALGFQASAVMGADGAGHFGVLLRWSGASDSTPADSAIWGADTVRVRAGTAAAEAIAAGDVLVFVKR